jgi:predicted ribosome quality control (RQC) complex YloA/Tae2 family protein
MKIFTINDITLILGTNAKENSQIVKEASQNYYWFHLKRFPSPHLILNSSEPSKNIIIKAAQFLKDNTKYKHMTNLIIEYTQIKNVKLTNIPGQVLLKKSPNQIKI